MSVARLELRWWVRSGGYGKTWTMDADEALRRAYNLMDEAGWTDEVMTEAERLLPILIDARYADADDHTWRFTPEGVERARAIGMTTPREEDSPLIDDRHPVLEAVVG